MTNQPPAEPQAPAAQAHLPATSDPLAQFTLTKDDASWAMLAHALTFIEGGVVGPLIVYLVKKDVSPFVAFHALQSFYFGLLFFLISLVTCGIGAILLIIPYFIYEFIALREANDGRWYRLPIVGSWAWAKHPGPSSEGYLPKGL